jgi:hypothetical protein
VILEGIVTTVDSDGTVNLSPMGPIVDAAMERLVLRPYQSSRTYQNLKRDRQGVFHVTDDAELLVHAAVGKPDPMPQLRQAPGGGWIIANACRWYGFQVEQLDDSQDRTRIDCRVTASGVLRDFFGFNRAKHAVLEAAILATRVHLLPAEELQHEFARLRIPVDKTGGDAELRAFEFLNDYVTRRLAELPRAK